MQKSGNEKTEKSLIYLLIFWIVSFIIDMLLGYTNIGRIVWYCLGIFSLCLAFALKHEGIKSEFRHTGLLHFALFVSIYSVPAAELPFGFLNKYILMFFENYPTVFVVGMVLAAPVIFLVLRYTYYRITPS